MEATEVLEQFCLLADLSPAQAQRFLPLARGCAARLLRRLRPDADAGAEHSALVAAAAGMLLYQYAAYTRSNGAAESFSLGDLSISSSSGGAGLTEARALRDELLAAVAHLTVSDRAFLIQVVEPE